MAGAVTAFEGDATVMTTRSRIGAAGLWRLGTALALVLAGSNPASAQVRTVYDGCNHEPHCLDLLFLPDDYIAENLTTFANDVYNYTTWLLSLEPFYSNLDRINVRRFDTTVDLQCHHGCHGSPSSLCCDDGTVFAMAIQAPYDEVIVLSASNEYGGSATLTPGGGGPFSYSVVYRNAWSLGRPLLAQLFGTSFGGLMSEAVTGGSGDPYGPNCAPAGCSSWSGLAGTGCVAGCTYGNLFRSTDDACLMHGLTPLGGQQYCPVCRRALASALACVGVTCPGPAPDPCHASTGRCTNATGGACDYPPLPDGQPCTDGNACTQGDACVQGACAAGVARVCPPPDACHLAGACDPASGACVYPPRANGTPCDDGDPCTRASACAAGACVGSDPLPCPPPANPCLRLVGCEPATGECRYAPRADGTPCDDFDFCTVGDACVGAWCVGPGVRACPAPDDCHYDGYCDQVSQSCAFLPRPNGSPCDDGDACTRTDTCQQAACHGHDPVDCGALGQCQLSVACDHGSGLCLFTPRPEGSPCDDGSACTAHDECHGGACLGHGGSTCPPPAPCREPATCDVASGRCVYPVSPDGTPCNDGNGCTPTDTCQSGACLGSGSVTCTAGGPCRLAGECQPLSGACTNPPAPNGTPCPDDANPCTSEACFGGACLHFPLQDQVGCPDDGLACTLDVCESGACSHPVSSGCLIDDTCHDLGAAPEGRPCHVCSPAAPREWSIATPGTPCDDGDPATAEDRCVGGACVGDAVLCVPAAPCLDLGVADPLTGTCSYAASPDGTPCDDHDPCTRFDACLDGACVGGGPRPCPPPGSCHVSQGCDSLSGECRVATLPDGAACDDGDACTQGDACLGGACAPGSPAPCEASGPCRVGGACDPATGGCVEVVRPDGSWCDDANACTRRDACSAGSCQGFEPVACPAPLPCHAALACDPATGACDEVPLPDGAPCDDGDPCTIADACTGGACAPGAPVSCEALDPCHVAGRCDPFSGTCTNPARSDDAPCDDGLACTMADTCQGGVCTPGVPVTCPAPDACRGVGVCEEGLALALRSLGEGGCLYPDRPDGTPCDDHDACTLGDACLGGACTSALTLECPPTGPCRAQAGCDPVGGQCVGTPLEDGLTCDDHDACTVGERCVAGACVTAGALPCPAPGVCEKTVVCQPATGACVADPKPDGSACDDGDPCTPDDACVAGRCVAGAPRTCPPAAPCQQAQGCDPATGACRVEAVPDFVACDDGDGCTAHDVCLVGRCTGHEPVLCPPASPCQSTSGCDPATGLCEAPAVANGTSCDDLDPCTLSDTCQDGACRGALFKVCPAKDECHSPGECHPLTGECSEPAKDDGSACAEDDDPCRAGGCLGGVCVVTTLPDGTFCPDDGLGCSADYCLGGACSHPVDGGCLIAGACVALDTPNPDNPCEACRPGSAFAWSPLADGALCQHPDECRTGGHCEFGACTGFVNAPAGTACGQPTRCLAGHLLTRGQCSAVGKCVAGPILSCEPYAFCATGSACGATCEKDPDCTPGYRCLEWECQMNIAPVAEAGVDQVVAEGAEVTLDGRLSSDADGDALGFFWSQIEGPTVTLHDKATATPGFVAPSVTGATALEFRLVVDDGAEPSEPSVTVVTVQNTLNEKPRADAGPDLVVDEGAWVTLDAGASTDPNGDALTVAWSQQAGPSVALSDAASTTPGFLAPYVAKDTPLLFMLIVNDGQANSTPDDVFVTVRETGAEPPEPAVEADAAGEAVAGEVVEADDAAPFVVDGGQVQSGGGGSSCAVGAPFGPWALLLGLGWIVLRRRLS